MTEAERIAALDQETRDRPPRFSKRDLGPVPDALATVERYLSRRALGPSEATVDACGDPEPAYVFGNPPLAGWRWRAVVRGTNAFGGPTGPVEAWFFVRRGTVHAYYRVNGEEPPFRRAHLTEEVEP